MKRAALSFCLAVVASGQTFQVWETVDAPVIERGRLFGVVHTQFRTRPNLHDYYQARVGPVLQFELSPGATLVGGYYFGEVESEERIGWGNNHRTFAGLETPFAWKGHALGLRSMVEHHFGGEDPPEVRLREQIRVVRPLAGPVSAIFGAETFFDQNGFFQQRSLTGLRLPFIGRYRLDITYIYDARVDRAGPGRHVIQTSLKPRRREN